MSTVPDTIDPLLRPVDPVPDDPGHARDIDRRGPERTPERVRQDTRAGGPPSNRPSAGRRFLNKWSRTIHVYTSMVAPLIILFFGMTGITLNHPDWTFGDDVEITNETGTLAVEPTMADGSVDYLSVSEFARDELGVSGSVDSFDVVNGEGSITYADPGYSADLFFDVETGEYELTVEQQGWVAVINDLHRGQDSGDAWGWVIDAAAVFLVVISLTGLVMQFFLKRRRRAAFVSAGVGATLVVALAMYAVA